MQQRGVIITAVILAIVLAGALWYTLTRDNGGPLGLVPTPTQVPLESTVPPIETPAVVPPEIVAGTTQQVTPVIPSAPTGTAENIVAGFVAASIVGAWQLSRNLRRGL